MAITVAERRNGTRLDAFGGEIEYIVRVTDSEATTFDGDDAYTTVEGLIGSTVPSFLNDNPISNVVVNESLCDLTGLQLWSVSAIYSVHQPTVFPTGSSQYEFNFTAPVGRVYYSLETRSVTGESTTYANDAFGGKIRGVYDDGDEGGVDLPNPSPTNSWMFNIPSGSVSLAYQQGIEAIMGMVNSGTFHGRAADTMRLVGCTGGARNDKDWQIRFDFQYSPNRTNVPIGGIVVPSIHGHNLVWDHINRDTLPTPVAGLGRVYKPTCIVVERVFERVNFGVLGF